MKSFLGIIIILVSIGIISVGIRYARTSKATFAKAGVKVDFKKTPATYGFAPGIMGAIIIIIGIAGLVWGAMIV
ncbi:hypothetical protein PET01_01880 [Pediococcus ethanolidurans]|nr:hypothetical protein PET01_01880 [Pediococcus ethanolidurans]SER06402.1 hypothetical protein SAMN04487973_101190 [Pediococcus ethanolidurans]